MKTLCELPDAAAVRWNELQMQRDSALDLARGVTARLSTSRDGDQRMRDQLVDQQTKHNARHAQLASLLSRINQWRAELPNGCVLEPAPEVDVEPRKGEAVVDAVERLRGEIVGIKQQLAIVRNAPLPRADAVKLIEAWVYQRAQAAKPSVTVRNDSLSVSWPETATAPSLLAWLCPSEMVSALVGELPAEAPGAMNAGMRRQRINQLEAQLIAAERHEVAMIQLASESGTAILHRVDVAPAAYLGVVIAAREQQVA
jgi:hypothetical protein